MIRMRSRRQKRMNPAAQVSLTPLIDTALTLLVVFMVTAPVAHHAIRVDLPRSATEDQRESTPHEVTITVDKSGGIFLEGAPSSRVEVIRALKEMKKTPAVIIFLRVDKKATYGNAIELLAELRQIEGIESVSFDIDFEQGKS
jgi:biopolymer transport protein ExbD